MPAPFKGQKLCISTEKDQDKLAQMIDTLERSLNNLNDDLQARFKKLVISQLSLLRYRDKDFNIKSVHAVGNERHASESAVYIDDLHVDENNYEAGKKILKLNEKEKYPTRQNIEKNKECLAELETLSRRKVWVEKDDITDKASTLFPETEQRRLSVYTSYRNYSDEDDLRPDNKHILTHIKPKPLTNKRQPCRNSFVSTSTYKSQTASHLQLPSPKDMNNTCYVGSSLQYKFPECAKYSKNPRITQQPESRFNERKEREMNNSPGTGSRGNKLPCHGHVRFDNNEVSTKYTKAEDSGPNSSFATKISNDNVQLKCTGMKEVYNEPSSDENNDYYTPNINYQSNDSDSKLYKPTFSRGLQKDKTTDIASEKRHTDSATEISDERFTDKSPVSVVLSPRIRKIQSILADYREAELPKSLPVSSTTEKDVTTEQLPGCKVDKWRKLKEKLNDSRKKLENEIPSYAKSNNSMTNDTKSTKHGFPRNELIQCPSPSPKAALESAAINTDKLKCKTIRGKSEHEARNLKAGRTMIVSRCLNRINNITVIIIQLMTNPFEDGVKNELWDDLQANLLGIENEIEDASSSLNYRKTDTDLEKAEKVLKDHLEKMILLGVKQGAVLNYHINELKMAAIGCETEHNDRMLLFEIRNLVKHLHSLIDLQLDRRNHHRSCPDVSNVSLTRPTVTEMTHPPCRNQVENQLHHHRDSAVVYPNVPPSSASVLQAVHNSSPQFSTQTSPSPPYSCIQLPVNTKENRQADELKASCVTQEINHRHELQNFKTFNGNLDRQKLNSKSNCKYAGYRELHSDRGTIWSTALWLFAPGFCIGIFLIGLVLWLMPNAYKAWLWFCSYLVCNVKVMHTSTPVV